MFVCVCVCVYWWFLKLTCMISVKSCECLMMIQKASSRRASAVLRLSVQTENL